MKKIKKNNIFFAIYFIIFLLVYSSTANPLLEKECTVISSLINTCKKDLHNCNDALLLKEKVVNKVLGDYLSRICYYVCVSEKTGYKKNEVNSAVDDFLKDCPRK